MVYLNKTNKISWSDTIFLLIAFLWLFFSRVYAFPIPYVVVEVIFGTIVLCLHVDCLKTFGIFKIIIISSLLLLSNLISGNNLFPLHVVSIGFMLPIAVLVYRKRFSIKLFKCFVFIIFIYIYLNMDYILNSLYDVSRNFISIYALTCLLPIFYKEQDNLFQQITFCVLGFFISVAAVGRGGILSFIVLILSFIGLYFLYGSKSSRKTKYFICISLFCLICFIIYIINNPEYSYYLFSRFYDANKSIEEESRSFIYAEYFASFNLNHLLFGKDISLCPTIIHYNGNPHNSFLKTHITYGIVGLFVVILVFYCGIKKYLKQRMFSFLVILIALLVRSMSDTCFPGGLFDIAIYILIFNLFVKDNENTRTVS